MALDPQLLEILACPDTHHAPLDYDPTEETLTCTQCRRVFEVRDGIPVLLLDEARSPASADGPERPAAAGEPDEAGAEGSGGAPA